MQDLFASGHIVDLILGLTMLEAVAIGLYHRWTGRGLPLRDIASHLAAGVFLLLALRAALTGADWTWIAAALAASLAAHVFDVRLRWKP